MNHSVSFIGGGRITRIFLQAFRNKNVVFKSTEVYDINPDVGSALKKQFTDIHTPDLADLKPDRDIVFIALHPPVIMETLEKIRKTIKIQLNDKNVIL